MKADPMSHAKHEGSSPLLSVKYTVATSNKHPGCVRTAESE